jgi:RNA-directed DNA polymerase
MRLPPSKIKTTSAGALYAFPQDTSVRRFKEKVRALTRRTLPGPTEALIPKLNIQVRGWGEHYKRAHVRGLFAKLDCWIVRRLRAHRSRRWRSYAWRQLPVRRLYGELQLVRLRDLIPS